MKDRGCRSWVTSQSTHTASVGTRVPGSFASLQERRRGTLPRHENFPRRFRSRGVFVIDCRFVK